MTTKLISTPNLGPHDVVKAIVLGLALGSAVTSTIFSHLIKSESADLHECVQNWQDTVSDLEQTTYNLRAVTAALDRETTSLDRCNEQLEGVAPVHD